MKQAIILFAHGSRDPLWHRPMQAVRERMAAAHPDLAVACAYLELSQPDLPHTVAEFVAQGITNVRVVPMFLGVGKHVRHDLPQMMSELSQQYPQVQFECTAAVGENEALLDLLARIAIGE